VLTTGTPVPGGEAAIERAAILGIFGGGSCRSIGGTII
jgi:hypothetical protein